MEAKLKNTSFYVGNGRIYPPVDRPVKITDTEDHPIFGKRYKIEGYADWFEANCFESTEHGGY
jgi:hypothetical protein